jgi:hypothetical protein
MLNKLNMQATQLLKTFIQAAGVATPLTALISAAHKCIHYNFTVYL